MVDLIDKIKGCNDLETAKELLYENCYCTHRVEEAITFTIKQHEGQKRKSGIPYAIHPILVATLVGHFVDGSEDVIIAALLHDIVEDVEHISLGNIEELFGKEVSSIVDGLTKIKKIRKDELIPSANTDEKLMLSARTFKNMLLQSIQNTSVLVIKLCDRLHNMLTLDALRRDKQIRISEETLYVYVPIAHQLGISLIKGKLEDLTLYYLHPEQYARINRYMKEHNVELQLKLNDFEEHIRFQLQAHGLSDSEFDIHSRVKHYHSIYQKMQRKGIEIEEVLDLLAVRILVRNELECYKVLGIIHTQFRHIPDRFKDYVALKKSNGYETIHTTVFDKSSVFEVQIRTFDMHKKADYGVAAHWKYKMGSSVNEICNLENIHNLKSKNDDEMFQFLKNELSDDITVLTPTSEPITLPRGSVVLDFAYAIHNELGDSAISATVDQIEVSLLEELRAGSIVRITKGEHPRVRCTWEEFVKTSKAKNAIRSACKKSINSIDKRSAVSIFASELNVPYDKIYDILEDADKLDKINETLYNRDKFDNILNFLETRLVAIKSRFKNYFDSIKKKKRPSDAHFDRFSFYSFYQVEAVDFDSCCHPKQSDQILAFYDRKSKIATIHQKHCDRAFEKLDTKQDMLLVGWQEDEREKFTLVVRLANRKGELAHLLLFLNDKLGISVDSVNLGVNPFEDSNNCTITFSSDETKVQLKSDIKRKGYTIVSLVSANDAYK